MLPGSVRYSRELADEICERLAEGESLKEICRSEHMPSSTAVRKWVIEDRDGFSSRYARARDLQIEVWADDLVEISDDGSNDWMLRNNQDNPGWQLNGEHVQRSRLRSDNRKWLLSKLRPDKYGDRMEHVGAGGQALIPDTKQIDVRILALLIKSGMSEDEARAALTHVDAG